MNKLSKAKRDQLIMVILGTLVVVAGLWYAVVSDQKKRFDSTRAKAAETESKLVKAEALLRRNQEIETLLQERKAELLGREQTLAPTRDTYGWMLKTIKPFILAHKGINVLSFNVPDLTDAPLIPKFDYKTATTQVRVNGSYQEIGKFVADFENAFPYFRLQALDLSPLADGSQRLNFKFDIVTLLRPVESEGEKP